MDNIKNKMDINWRYLAVIATVILSPFIYNSIRIFWIVDQGESSLALTHFSTYLQMTMEIVGAFLLIPLFTYNKEEYKSNSFTLFLTVTCTMLIFTLAGLAVSGFLIKPMLEMNPTESKSVITTFLIFQSLTWVLIVYEQYLLTDFIIEGKITKAVVFTILSITLKVAIDILMLSPIAVIDYGVVSVSLSSFLSSLTIVIVLVSIHLLKMKEEEQLNIAMFDLEKLKSYYYRGVFPAMELLIRNLCYSLVTLQALLMLGESDWNAWNMGGYVYWMMVFKVTSIFDYYLLSDLAKTKDNHNFKLITFASVEVVTILILGVVLSSAYLPFLVQGETYAGKAILLSFVNLPIMMFIAVQNVFKTKLVISNNYIYLFFGTIFNLIVLYLPLIIIIYFTNVQIGFWSNFIIFGMSCLIPAVITVASVFYVDYRNEKMKLELEEYVQEI